jgi:hypothetical protein
VDVDVTVETLIAHPIEVVGAYAGDPSNAPGWYANIDSIRWLTEPPMKVGSQIFQPPARRDRQARRGEDLSWGPATNALIQSVAA